MQKVFREYFIPLLLPFSLSSDISLLSCFWIFLFSVFSGTGEHRGSPLHVMANTGGKAYTKRDGGVEVICFYDRSPSGVAVVSYI